MPQLPPPALSVIIPVRDKWDLTRQCLSSLRDHVPGQDYEVLVVDNASSDATAGELSALGQSLFGRRFRVLRQEENLGFARAVNLGAKESQGRRLFLLNNDTLFLNDCTGDLLAALDADPSCRGAGPLLLYPETRRVQHLGVAVAHGVKSVHLYRFFPAAHPVARKKRRLRIVSAAALCLERDFFLSQGGFFEGFVNGMEDIDFCARVAQQGFHFTVVPHCPLLHLEGQSVGRRDKDRANSRLLQQRAGPGLVPDMAALAREDGYAMRLTPWLDPYLVPARERTEALQADLVRDPSPEHLLELLEAEPCWQAGYDALARRFAAQGDKAGVLEVRLRQSLFLPTPETLGAVLGAALDAGDGEAEANCRAAQSEAEALLRQAEGLKNEALRELAKARERGDAYVQGLFKEWLTRCHAATRARA